MSSTSPPSITSGIFGTYDDVSQPRAVQLTVQYDW